MFKVILPSSFGVDIGVVHSTDSRHSDNITDSSIRDGDLRIPKRYFWFWLFVLILGLQVLDQLHYVFPEFLYHSLCSFFFLVCLSLGEVDFATHNTSIYG